MDKLYNIKGYYNKEFKTKYSKENSWFGQIVVFDYNWFEGLVFDGENREFVFGIFHEGKILELYKMCKENGTTCYHLEYFEGGYEGGFEDVKSIKTLGMSRVCTQLVKGNDVEKKIKNLQKYVNLHMHNCFDDESYCQYLNVAVAKKALSKMFLKGFDGTDYTKEEIDNLLDIVDDISDDVVSTGKQKSIGNR